MQPYITMTTSTEPIGDPTQMSGLELLRAWQAAPHHDQPGIGRLLGMRPASIEEGEVRFVVTPKPDFSNPLGTVHGGICATLLDSVMGCAVHTTLPAGVGYTTLELKVNYIRSVALDAGELTGVGTVIHVGGRTATAEGKVFSADGKLVAHGTTTCIVFR
ncbi:PaaI family thioesterase [Gordonia desulfuricans]|uniref:PaaI family thioesterase n=1 Tax=Gordonia desulfuricans TaxID=89051 RepID=A0A7K3LP12_9ACTN|nr:MULTISPECIES: PaaI family thioesterase [Gordonia]EMP10009.2 thioesterase [Gordonia sp. NB41Y]NDK89985.1 PaaI family thioesterase [Gordonia desulfuricans]WLP92295.1 PaaI family thioesterase [Gordonia sp. NB41Y]